MNIFFYNYNRAYSPIIPIGISILSSVCSNAGHSTRIIDPKPEKHGEFKGSEYYQEIALSEIAREKPGILAFSVYTNDVPSMIDFTKKVKSVSPATKIIVGGPHVNAMPLEIFKYAPIDFAVLGEGEITFPELLDFAEKEKKDFSKVKGIVWKKTRGKGFSLKKNPERKLIEDLDSIPFPDYAKLPMEYYTYPHASMIRGILASQAQIFTSRGCPFRCSYCSSFLVFGRQTRCRSPENVVDEIELLEDKYRIDAFYVLDDSFTVYDKHVFGIIDEMKKRKIDLFWGCETRVNLLNEAKIKAMSAANCLQIDFGIESGSPKVLKALRKDITPEQAFTAFELCRKYKIRTYANFMINNPSESFEDIEMTKNVAKKLNPSHSGVWVTTPYPSTQLCSDFGIDEMSLEDYKELTFGGTSRYNQPQFKDVDLFKLSKQIQNEIMGFKQVKDSLFPFPARSAYFKRLLKSSRKQEYAKCWLGHLLSIVKNRL